MGLLEDLLRTMGDDIKEGLRGLKDHVFVEEPGVFYSDDPAEDVERLNEHIRRRLRLRDLPRPNLDIDKDPDSTALTDQFVKAAQEIGWTSENISDFFADRDDGWTPPQELFHPFKLAKRDLAAVRRFTNHSGPLTDEERDQLQREDTWRLLIDRADYKKELQARDEQDFEAWREARRRKKRGS